MNIFPYLKPYSTVPRTTKQVVRLVKTNHKAAVLLRDTLLATSQLDEHKDNNPIRDNIALLSRAIHAYRGQLNGRVPEDKPEYAPIYKALKGAK